METHPYRHRNADIHTEKHIHTLTNGHRQTHRQAGRLKQSEMHSDGQTDNTRTRIQKYKQTNRCIHTKRPINRWREGESKQGRQGRENRGRKRINREWEDRQGKRGHQRKWGVDTESVGNRGSGRTDIERVGGLF